MNSDVQISPQDPKLTEKKLLLCFRERMSFFSVTMRLHYARNPKELTTRLLIYYSKKNTPPPLKCIYKYLSKPWGLGMQGLKAKENFLG